MGKYAQTSYGMRFYPYDERYYIIDDVLVRAHAVIVGEKALQKLTIQGARDISQEALLSSLSTPNPVTTSEEFKKAALHEYRLYLTGRVESFDDCLGQLRSTLDAVEEALKKNT